MQTEGTAAGAQRPLFRHSQLCFLMGADARRAPRLKRSLIFAVITQVTTAAGQ